MAGSGTSDVAMWGAGDGGERGSRGDSGDGGGASLGDTFGGSAAGLGAPRHAIPPRPRTAAEVYRARIMVKLAQQQQQQQASLA